MTARLLGLQRLLACLACLVGLGIANRALALDHAKPFGEPYELLGKRLAFTTWYFVRPGQPQWFDPKTGHEIDTDATAGPFDHSFRLLEAPFGIRLITEPAQRSGPIIPRNPEATRGGTSIFSILQDGGTYRAWGGSEYYESKDGRN